MRIVWLILAGIAGGVISGMGMGGGTLLIPILTILLGVEQSIAQAVNLISFVPVAIVSLVFHIKNKLVEWKSVLYMIIPSLATGIGASLLADTIDNQSLRMYFGIFLCAIGVWIIVDKLFIGTKSQNINKECQAGKEKNK